jgi:hypothetical protein
MLGDEFERYRFKTQRKNIEHILGIIGIIKCQLKGLD